MKLPILYSKAKTGAVLQWEIETEGGKFRTHEGQLGGVISVSDWTLTTGKNAGKKNATTDEEQALAEAQARWDKKKKTGHSENIESAGEKNYVQCMLAEKYDDYKDEITFPCVIQTKLNGVRSITEKDTSKSRKGELWMAAPHINKALFKFFLRNPDAVLDGEYYSYEYREKLNELIKIVRKTTGITPELLKKSEEVVQYYVYDGYLSKESESKPYKERMDEIEQALFSSGSDYCDYEHDKYPVKIMNYDEADFNYRGSWPANSHEDILRLFKLAKEDKEEGVMVRWGNEGYIHSRTKYLLKVKSIDGEVQEDDDEGEIMAIHAGKGNWGSAAKTATIKWKDRTFDATLVGTMEECREVLKNKENWLGKIVTFYFIGLTGLQNPNYGRVKIANCSNDKFGDKGVIE